jgi:hypothetical protein
MLVMLSCLEDYQFREKVLWSPKGGRRGKVTEEE